MDVHPPRLHPRSYRRDRHRGLPRSRRDPDRSGTGRAGGSGHRPAVRRPQWAGVTNTGPSVLNGDLGVSPGTSLSGFGSPSVVNGAIHANDAVAAQAESDLTTAYNVAAGQPVPPGNELTGVDLGGLTLGPGAYGYSTSAQLTGQLTLDAHGDPNAQFVFVIGTTLTTATASSVILTDGASPCNVYWKVGSSATLGTGTAFEGSILALTSISLSENATVLGRLLARNGAVTLIEDVLTAPGCATGSSPSATEPGSTVTPTAAPGTPVATPIPVVKKGAKESPNGAKGGGGKKAPEKSESGTATAVRGAMTPTGVTVTVHGKEIRTITASDNGERIAGARPGAQGPHRRDARCPPGGRPRHLHRSDQAEDVQVRVPGADPGAASPRRTLAVHRMTIEVFPAPGLAASAAGRSSAWRRS